MSFGTVLFLVTRALHVLLAAAWLGSAAFTALMLTPAVADAGPAGGQVMIALHRRRVSAYFASLGGATVLTGIYLFWRFTGGFSPEVSRSHAGLAFGIGGVSGILALLIGGARIAAPSKKLVALMESLANAQASERPALMQQANAIRQGIATATKIVLVLQSIALVLMALGHYI